MELGRARLGRYRLPAQGPPVLELPAPVRVRVGSGPRLILGAVLASPIGSQPCDLPSEATSPREGRCVAAGRPKKTEGPGHVVELFAGVGGFRVALERSGWQTI